MTYLVDQECVRLAEYFIAAEIGSTVPTTSVTLDAPAVRSLAEAIQKSVEAWFEEKNRA